MNKLLQERESINKLFKAPEYHYMKYVALSVISICIILLLSIIIWIDDISPKAILFMRGCAGLCALVFIIIVGILVYRVNVRHIKNRHCH